MNEDHDLHPVSEVQSPSVSLQLTFIERYGISPVLFVFVSLVALFLLYQGIPSLITFLIFGFKVLQNGKIITPENVNYWRMFTGLSQIVLLLLPTLYLVRLVSNRPRDFFRLRFPSIAALGLPAIGILSLQQMLGVYLIFQEKIPLPEQVEVFLQKMKEMTEEVTKLFATSHSVTELVWVVIIIAVIPAFVEELLFRGLVQRSFEKSMRPMSGAILAGILFGMYHVNPSSFVALSVLGIYLGFLAMRADSIWVSVAAHFYNNLYVCIVAYLQLNDDFILTGDPGQMSVPNLLLTFFLFSMIFAVSTFYFVKATAGVTPKPLVIPEIS